MKNHRTILPGIVIVLAVIIACHFVQAAPPKRTNVRSIGSAYYPLQIHYFNNLTAASDRKPGGAIEKIGDQYIAVTGTGAFYLLTLSDNSSSVTSRKIQLPSPLNTAAFDAAVNPVVNREYFRVIDFVARKSEGNWQLFVSHHYWKEKEKCVVLRISALTLGPAKSKDYHWETIYETTPCLTLDSGNRGKIFSGHEAGGRLAWLAENKLLLTSGDQEHDGWNHPVAVSQDDTYMYGKTLLIDVKTHKAEIFTRGHRNPQGLTIDKEGNIWLTEHGPRGGDELNLLYKGRNYGWPYETFGTEYGSFVWPMTGKNDKKIKFEQPVFAWVPSIGISNLIRLDDDKFSRWKDNLLITSLTSFSLFRVELVDKRVVYVEQIPIGRRIRDLIVGPDENIWLWGELGDLISVSVSDAQDSGEVLFQTMCAGCHTTGYASGGMAPTLRQVVGRQIASRKDFNYSPGFKALTGEWTNERLDKFLSDPISYAPGTLMNNIKVEDPKSRSAIIEYLRSMPIPKR